MEHTRMHTLTNEFYAWEARGRGWLLADEPVELEPPFVPFFYHASPAAVVDDAKRPTLLSTIASLFKNQKKKAGSEAYQMPHPEPIEPFRFECDEALITFRIRIPKEETPEEIEGLLIMLSYCSYPVSFEIIATHTSIHFQFVIRETDEEQLQSQLTAFMPGFPVQYVEEGRDAIFSFRESPTCIMDMGLSEEWMQPIIYWNQKTTDPYTALLGICEGLQTEEHIALQVLFSGAINQWALSMQSAVTDNEGDSFFVDAPDMPKLAKEKGSSPLFAVVIRTITQAQTIDKAYELSKRVSFALSAASRSPYNSLALLEGATYDFDTRVSDVLNRESHRLGMLLNSKELMTLVHMPQGVHSAKLYPTERKTKAAPLLVQEQNYILGTNTHEGTETPVGLSEEQRLKHMHLIGATGTGKSTLLLQLITQDIAEGNGCTVIDPHGDLIDAVVHHIPPSRAHDVILIDPSDAAYPVGLNILSAHSAQEKEVLSSDLISVFRRLSTSWGDQMNAVFGNALLAFLESSKGGTLPDLRRFLLEKEFRASFLETVPDPHIKYYWQKEFPILKTSSIGPILTRLDSFLRPRTIRNMVGQKRSIDFHKAIQEKKILLVKLAQGIIGAENSYVLGTFIVSKLHQAALSQQSLIPQKRTSHFLYMDEFHHFLTPSITDMISGVRKYGLGLILAHQDLQQLQKHDTELLSAILGNIYTRIVFRVGEADAKKVSEGFSFFDASDFQNLGRGEALVRVERPQYDFSITTYQYEAFSDENNEEHIQNIIAHSRKKYATAVAEIENIYADDSTPKATVNEEKVLDIKEQPIALTKKPEKEIEVTTTADENISTEPTKNKTEHRYLQTLIKRMAESYDYAVTLEAPTIQSQGSVDVLLYKGEKTIAIEICVTTDTAWEVHNIEKCLKENFSEIISVCTDAKRLSAIQKLCSTNIIGFEQKLVLFYTPDELFTHLSTKQVSVPASTQTTMKGYRVNVSYEGISQTEMEMKRKAVAGVVLQAIKKQKRKT